MSFRRSAVAFLRRGHFDERPVPDFRRRPNADGRDERILASIPAPELGAACIRALVSRTGVAGDNLDEVIMGNVIGAGLGQNPARQAAIFGGLPKSVGAMTVNKVCGSGLKAVMLADQAIRTGDARS